MENFSIEGVHEVASEAGYKAGLKAVEDLLKAANHGAEFHAKEDRKKYREVFLRAYRDGLLTAINEETEAAIDSIREGAYE